MAELAEKLVELLESLGTALRARLPDGEGCIVLFGAGAAVVTDPPREVAPPQRLHILVVWPGLPTSRWDRHDLVYEALLALEGERDEFNATTGWYPYLAVHIMTPDELGRAGPLPPAFDEGTWLVSDPGDLFPDLRRQIERRWALAGARSLGSGSRVYWDVAPEYTDDQRVPERYRELGRGYLRQAEIRLRVAATALEEEHYAYAVQLAHETVELSLKGMLAHVGIDPPGWHDVGRQIREHADRFPELEASVIDELAAISSKLREHRESSVYGDRLSRVDPERLFSEYDARVSREWATQAFEIGLRTLNQLPLHE